MTATTPETVSREQYDAIYARWSALTTLATERLLALNEATHVIERVRAWGREFDNPDAEPYSFADEMLTVISSLFSILDATPTASPTLAAVTAERDQALEALAAENKLGAFETGKTIGAAEVRKELDQARQMLADAPHADSCSLENSTSPNPPACDCWKAGL